MNDETREPTPELEQDWRQRLLEVEPLVAGGPSANHEEGGSCADDHRGPRRAASPHVPAAPNTFPSRGLCTSGCWMNSTGETCWRPARRR